MLRPSIASKYLSKLARLRPSSLHNHGLQMDFQPSTITASKLARSQRPSVSPNSHDYGLQVRTIMDSKCISPNSHNYGLQSSQNHSFEIHISHLAQLRIPSSHDHSLQVHIYISLILISECNSEFTRLRPLTISPNTLNYHLQVHLQTHSITASECISLFTQL